MSPEALLNAATLADLKRGYLESTDAYTCLCCGERVEKGVVYPVGDRLLEAGRYIQQHIAEAHGSVFAHLVALDKQAHGLSDLQRRLLTLFYEGKSDEEIKALLGAGSLSTIRNHRFILREKERQARIFLAIMELLHERQSTGGATGAHGGKRSRSARPPPTRELPTTPSWPGTSPTAPRGPCSTSAPPP